MTGLAGLGLAAKLTGAKAALAKIPWQVWAVLALVLAIGIGSCVHGKKVKSFGTERYDTGVADGKKARDAEIKALQNAKAEADRKLAAEIRKRVNAENTRIDTTASNILVRGPGRATCTNPPTTRSSASGHQPAAAEVNAARSGVPAEDFAAVPWGWLVKRATEHDKCLVEAGAWREQKAAELTAYRESQR